MAVTRESRSIVLTELNDAVAYPIFCSAISLVGTGMTIGQRLTITDGESIVVDHYVGAENESVEFLNCDQWFGGLLLAEVPAAGTWTVTVRLK